MSRSTADLLALKAELTNDPKSLGLTTVPADDESNANKLNLVRESLQVQRQNVPASEVVGRLNREEFNASTLADQTWMRIQLEAGLLDLSDARETKAGLQNIFRVGKTRNGLEMLFTESANRIEHMFRAGLLAEGGSVTPSDVANARQA